MASAARRLSVTVCDDVARIAVEWDELADRIGAPVFLRPGWFEAWARAFAGSRLALVVVRDGGRLAAVLPLRGAGGAVRSAANYHTPLFDVIAEDDAARFRAVAFALALAERSLRLDFVDPGSTTVSMLKTSNVDHRVMIRPIAASPYLEVDGSWPDFERRLSHDLRHRLRRRQRRLEELGRVTFTIHNGPYGLDAALAEGFVVEAAGWKGERGTAIASHENTRRFYTEVARWATSRGLLRLAFLRLHRQPVAFQYAVQENGILYLLKAGFTPDFAHHSPSALLLARLLRYAFDTHLERVEMLGNADPYKMEWTRTTRDLVSIHAFSSSVPGRLEGFAYGRGRRVASGAMRTLQQVAHAVTHVLR